MLWPAVAAVRRRFPAVRIDLMGQRERCQTLVVPGGADQALEVEGSGLHHLFDVSPSLPSEVRARFGGYDTAIAFASPGDYALAENLSACGVGEVHAFLPFPSLGEGVHVAEHAKHSLIGVDLAAAGDDPRLPVSDSERAAGAVRVQAARVIGRPLVAISPGSGSFRKNWKAKGFAELIGTLQDEGLEPILIEGPADKEAVAAVLAAIRGRAPIVFRDDSPSVLKGILSHTILLVGNDAGPTHLAALIGVPTVAVFGPSDPVLWAPRGDSVTVIRAGCSCSPCSEDALHACTERICLERVEFASVLEACRRFLQHPGSC